jgi:hypothetical protein
MVDAKVLDVLSELLGSSHYQLATNMLTILATHDFALSSLLKANICSQPLPQLRRVECLCLDAVLKAAQLP